jgi:hypothetical protein
MQKVSIRGQKPGTADWTLRCLFGVHSRGLALGASSPETPGGPAGTVPGTFQQSGDRAMEYLP